MYICSYHSVIKGWIDCNTSQTGVRADALLQRMIKNNFTPNIITYQLVFEALIKSSRGKGHGIIRAETLIKRIDEHSKRTQNNPLRPNTMLANVILQGTSLRIFSPLASHFLGKNMY